MKKHNKELEIDEDITLESTNWTIQRVAWVVMALVVLAALLGFTGDGGMEGINRLTAGSEANGLEVEYERFLRRKAPAELTVRIFTPDNPARQELQFSKDFYEKVQVEQVVPEPVAVYTHPQGITYLFSGDSTLTTVTFYLKPKTIGNLEMDVSAEGQRLAFSQFIYP